MDAITQKILNDFSKSQPALQLPGKPSAIAGIKLGDLIAQAAIDIDGVAAHVASLGALAAVGVAPTTIIGPLTPVGVGAVDTACALAVDVNTELGTLQAKIDTVIGTVALISDINARITSVQGKIDAVIAALIAAGLML